MSNLGHTLDSAKIEMGLRELNKDLHFDMGTKLGMWHPMQSHRQGVFYHGQHICSMDRGIVPEFKQWTTTQADVPVSWNEADMDDVKLSYETIPKSHPMYTEIYVDTSLGKVLDCFIRPDGVLVKVTPKRTQTVLNRVYQVGWRHTFERLIHAKIPGVTRQSIAEKFNVDMLKYPVGPPEEVYAALVAE